MAADLGGDRRYINVVGEIPDVSDVAGWAAAWEREEAREWTRSTRAHALFRDLDGGTAGNAFLKQMRLLPDALVPAAEDRSDSITVVRRPSEVGYMRTYHQRRAAMAVSSHTAPAWEFVVMSPPYLGLPLDYPPHPTITASRNCRTASCPFLVGWHQAEFTSCPQPRRAQYYPRVPPWWTLVEVPYGAMVELPPVQAYMSAALLSRDDFAGKVLRSEWAVMAGAYLLDCFRTRGILWLYPKALRTWILRVGLRAICQGPEGADDRAVEELGALLALLDILPVGPTLTHRLGRASSERRDRSSWVSVVVTTDGSVTEAKVDEDLHPLVLPYSADILERRVLAQEATGWDQAVVSSRPPDRGPSGTEQAGSSIPSVSQGMIHEGLPPAATGPRIVTVSLPTHRDIQDHTLDALWHAPPPALRDVLVPFLGVDQRAVDRLHMGPLLAALLHTMVRQGESVRLWTEEQAGMSTHGAAELLNRFGRDALREVVLREVDTAEAGYSRRANTGDPSTRGQVRAREDDGEEGQGGPQQRYRSGPPSWW